MLWISAAISTITKAALKAATTRFKRVRSLIGRDGTRAAPGGAVAAAHENHEPSFMMPLIRRIACAGGVLEPYLI